MLLMKNDAGYCAVFVKNSDVDCRIILQDQIRNGPLRSTFRFKSLLETIGPRCHTKTQSHKERLSNSNRIAVLPETGFSSRAPRAPANKPHLSRRAAENIFGH